jgi:hypothetical protein
MQTLSPTCPSVRLDPDPSVCQVETDGRYYLTLVDPDAARTPGFTGSYTWELTPRIASVAGLVYWVLIAVLIPLVVKRNPVRRFVDVSSV